jgi:tetratricopeptide (TPR) repeat protein
MKTPSRRKSKRSVRENLETQLAQLESAQLVHSAGEEERTYVFKHNLTQEAAYESLLLKQRREIHRLVGETYEQLYADRLDEFAAVLAQHYAQAGEDPKTLEYSIRAGDVAMRVYANGEAVMHYARALQVVKSQSDAGGNAVALRKLYVKRGRALELLSHFDEAAHNYDEMHAVARELGDRAFELAALIACATIRSIPGSARDETRGRALADQALTLARELGDRAAQAKILWILLLLNIYTGGDTHQSIQWGEESLAIARELNLREQMAYTLHDLFVTYAQSGKFEQARAVRIESGKIWRELDNKPMLAESVSGLALLHFLHGEFDQALARAQEGFQISTSISNLGGQGFGGYNLGLIYYERGELAQAIKSMEDALPITQFGGLEGNGLSPYGVLAVIHADMGDHEKALEFLRLALERPSGKLSLQRMWLFAMLARVQLIAGNLKAAEEAFGDGGVVVSIETSSGMFPAAAPDIHFVRAELALGQKDYGQAVQVIDLVLEQLLRTRGVRVSFPQALYLKALALSGQHLFDQALAALHEACTEAQTMGSRRHLWKILATIGEIEAARGNNARADAVLGQARQVIDYIAEHAPPELRETFLNSTAVSAVPHSRASN